MKLVLKKDQAYERIRKRIAQGELKPGEKLPQGVDLAKEMGFSHITLRAALARLEKDGLVESIHGRGTFVCGNPDHVVFRTIGLILPSLGKPLTPGQSPTQYNIVSNLMNAAESRRFEIRTLHRGRKNFDSEGIRHMGVDAVAVVLPHSSDAGMLTELRGLGVPLLAFNLFNSSLNRWHHCLNVDYARMAADSVSLLHAQGRRKIAFLSYYDLQPDLHPGLLLGGYLARMEELGLAPTIIQVAALPYGVVKHEEAERLVRLHVAKLQPVDAIIGSHTEDSLAVLRVLRDQGVRLPEEKALISCFEAPSFEAQGLTAWRVPWHEVAEAMVSCLEVLMRNPETPPKVTLAKGELVRRQTA